MAVLLEIIEWFDETGDVMVHRIPEEGSGDIFINTLVGTRGMFDTSAISDYLRDVIVSRLNDLLGETLDTIFDLPRLYDEFAVALKSRVTDDFERYGIGLVEPIRELYYAA